MLAMTQYPDILLRAQKEIDDVVGKDRLPTFEDQESLPYLAAIVKEIVRYGEISVTITGLQS